MSRRVLVTGATGYVGKGVVQQYLDLGFEVYALGRDEAKLHELSLQGANAVSVDLTDRERVEDIVSRIQPDTVIHLAAYPRRKAEQAAGDVELEKSDLYKLNVVGTANLVEATKSYANASGTKVHFHYVSTGSAFVQDSELTTLSSPRERGLPYEATKNLAEEYIRRYHDNYLAYSITYSPVIFDETQTVGIIPKAVRQALAGENLVNMAAPNAEINLITSEDFSHLVSYITASKGKAEHSQYLIQGVRVPITELLETIAEKVAAITGKRVEVTQAENATFSGMPAADETNIKKLFGEEPKWSGLDAIIDKIIAREAAALKPTPAVSGNQLAAEPSGKTIQVS